MISLKWNNPLPRSNLTNGLDPVGLVWHAHGHTSHIWILKIKYFAEMKRVREAREVGVGRGDRERIGKDERNIPDTYLTCEATDPIGCITRIEQGTP